MYSVRLFSKIIDHFIISGVQAFRGESEREKKEARKRGRGRL